MSKITYTAQLSNGTVATRSSDSMAYTHAVLTSDGTKVQRWCLTEANAVKFAGGSFYGTPVNGKVVPVGIQAKPAKKVAAAKAPAKKAATKKVTPAPADKPAKKVAAKKAPAEKAPVVKGTFATVTQGKDGRFSLVITTDGKVTRRVMFRNGEGDFLGRQGFRLVGKWTQAAENKRTGKVAPVTGTPAEAEAEVAQVVKADEKAIAAEAAPAAE